MTSRKMKPSAQAHDEQKNEALQNHILCTINRRRKKKGNCDLEYPLDERSVWRAADASPENLCFRPLEEGGARLETLTLYPWIWRVGLAEYRGYAMVTNTTAARQARRRIIDCPHAVRSAEPVAMSTARTAVTTTRCRPRRRGCWRT